MHTITKYCSRHHTPSRLITVHIGRIFQSCCLITTIIWSIYCVFFVITSSERIYNVAFDFRCTYCERRQRRVNNATSEHCKVFVGYSEYQNIAGFMGRKWDRVEKKTSQLLPWWFEKGCVHQDTENILCTLSSCSRHVFNWRIFISVFVYKNVRIQINWILMGSNCAHNIFFCVQKCEDSN